MASGSTSYDKFEDLYAYLDKYNVSVNENRKPPIQKIPFMSKEHRETAKFLLYFEPRVVSIGPIHHGNEKFKPGEEIKCRLAAQFIKETTQKSGKTDKSLLKVIEDAINDLRKCYTDDVVAEFDHEKLAWILFVDGCALLHFVRNAAGDGLKDLKLKSDIATFAQHDFLLLENQIPYQVLELLMRETTIEEDLRKSVREFIVLATPTQVRLEQDKLKSFSSPTHLLDLLRTALLYSSPPHSRPSTQQRPKETQLPSGGCSICIPCGGKKHDGQVTFRNIKELKAAGIQVKRNEKSCLKEIEFKHKFCVLGRLMLPPIRVDNSTASIFLNLASYEKCLEYQNNFEISSYICFLNSLIDDPEDVKELKEANVLHNSLGSVEEVATLFKEIRTYLVPNDVNDVTYEKVKRKIQSHFDQKCFTWIAQAGQVIEPLKLLGLLRSIFSMN